MVVIQIDNDKCNTCGICGDVCPRHILRVIELETKKKKNVVSSERGELCMGCGHCAAVCPNQAVHVEGFKPTDFKPMQKNKMNLVFLSKITFLR